MTLEGAINFNETNDYIIYTMNSVMTGQYGVVVPKNVNGTVNMLIDLHMKGSFDGVGAGTKTKEQLVDEISVEYNKLKAKYADGMLVMPMIDEVNFQAIVNNSDKQKMFDEVKKIGAITSELYKKLTEQGVDKQKIDQKIIVVEKTGEDERFVSWLKEQSNMSNFVDGIRYSELNVMEEVTNPFVNSNIFGPAVDATPVEEPTIDSTPVIGGIFDNVAPVTSVTESVVPVAETVAPTVPVETVTTSPVESVVPVVEQPVVQTPSSGVDLFGTSTSAQNNEVVNASVQSIPSAPVQVQAQVASDVAASSVQAPVVEGPKPVESATLEGTIAFTPIPNNPNNPTEAVVAESEEAVAPAKGSKGFANLAILLVVLIAVTIVSIELGKYLYSVYGA